MGRAKSLVAVRGFEKGVSRTVSPRFLKMKRKKKKKKKTEENRRKRKKTEKKRKETEENGRKRKKRKNSEATRFWRPLLRNPDDATEKEKHMAKTPPLRVVPKTQKCDARRALGGRLMVRA